MRSKWGEMIAAAAFGAVAGSAGPSMAQVPIIDAPATSNTVSLSVQLSAELKQLSGWATTVQSSLNVQHDISVALGFIGFGGSDTGDGTMGSLIHDAEMGFQTFQQAKNTFEKITNELHSLSDPSGSFSILTLMSQLTTQPGANASLGVLNVGATLGPMQQLASGSLAAPNGITTVETNMFTQYGTPSASQVENVNGVRRAVAQNGTIQGMTLASATTQAYKPLTSSTQTLANGMVNATNNRGDWKANSAIWMKVLEQATAQNHILGRLLYVKANTVIGGQPPYGPLAGTQLP